jgi:hypothetical protein
VTLVETFGEEEPSAMKRVITQTVVCCALVAMGLGACDGSRNDARVTAKGQPSTAMTAQPADLPGSVIVTAEDHSVELVSTTTGTVRTLYRPTSTTDLPLASATDGGEVVFVATKADNECGGSILRVDTSNSASTDTGLVGRSVAVSPDGRMVAYQRVKEGNCAMGDLALRDLSTGTEQVLANPASSASSGIFRIRVAADNTHVAFVLGGGEDGSLDVVLADFGVSVPRSEPLRSSYPDEWWGGANFVPDGLVLLAGCCRRGVPDGSADFEPERLVLLKDGQRTVLREFPDPVADYDIDPAGKYVAWVTPYGVAKFGSVSGSDTTELRKGVRGVSWGGASKRS